MLTRRVATFLTGAWLGCGILVLLLAIQNGRWADRLLAEPSDGARTLLAKVGDADARLLMRYLTSEQTRSYLSNWELAQLVMGGVVAALFVLASERRYFPIVLTVAMLGVVLFQHFGLGPEMAFRGRQADFLPEESAYSVQSRLQTLVQLYAGVEGLKLMLGGVLVSYLFAATSGIRVRKKKRRSEADPLHRQMEEENR
jgi:hypothetical protein